MGCLVEKEGDLRGREWIETNADGMGGTIPGRWKGEGGGVDRKRLLGHANALAEMHQRPGEPGEAGGVKRVAAVGVWFQKAGKGMEGFSTGSGFSGAPETLKGVKSAHAPSGGGYVAAWLRFQI